MYRKLEVMTPDCEKLLVAHAPTFDLASQLIKEAQSLGLEVRLTTGQFYPPDEATRKVWVSKDELGMCIRLHPYDMTSDWRYCDGDEYQVRNVPTEESYNDYVMGVFHAYFRDVAAALVRREPEGKGNAA
jgi:hypothetical protein